MSEPIYYERALAPILGLTRDDLHYLRVDALKKIKGAWRQEGRHVVITQTGLDAILARLRTTHNDAPADEMDFSPALVPLPEKKGPPLLLCDRARPGLVKLKVLRCYPNPKMLRAQDPEGVAVDVRVKTNKNFVPGMELNGRLVCPGKYEMEGRCPRTRGRY